MTEKRGPKNKFCIIDDERQEETIMQSFFFDSTVAEEKLIGR